MHVMNLQKPVIFNTKVFNNPPSCCSSPKYHMLVKIKCASCFARSFICILPARILTNAEIQTLELQNLAVQHLDQQIPDPQSFETQMSPIQVHTSKFPESLYMAVFHLDAQIRHSRVMKLGFLPSNEFSLIYGHSIFFFYKSNKFIYAISP